jgi:hypothetical protein
MAVGRTIRQALPEPLSRSGSFVAKLAPALTVILLLSVGLARAQWSNEPTVDPFAQSARPPANAAASGTAAPRDASSSPHSWQGQQDGNVPSPTNVPIRSPYAVNGAPEPIPLASGPYLEVAPPTSSLSPSTAQGALPAAAAQYPGGIPYAQYPPPPPGQNDLQPQFVPPQDQAMVPAAAPSEYRFLDHLEGNVVARGFYSNDQRIEWSGMEATFGAEAVLTPRLRQRYGDFEFLLDSELNINEPFNQNQLLDDPERKSYAANFQVNQFDISQLALVTNYGDWTFKAGKFVTPFGRTYFPLYTNSYWDSPFIRTEVIVWRETGILAHYKSNYFVGDVALTNGGENKSVNSGKSVIARFGLESDFWAIGVSAKKGAGVGSEIQKEFSNYYGVDMMVRSGPFQLSAECIYDEYGFGRPGFDPNDITWVKSIYYRDVSSGQQGVPCTGIGYYVNLGYAEGPWNALVNYGDFYPLFTGTASDQRVQHRGLIKVAYQFAKPLQMYTVLIVENGGYTAQESEPRIPVAVLQGCQFTF